MSTHIVDNIVAARLPVEGATTYYIVAELGGDNNVIETQTRRRARDWSCAAAGMEWQVIQEATESAVCCAGGTLRLAGSRRTKPEAYIRAYRRALAQAQPLAEVYAQCGLRFAAQIKLKTDPMTTMDKWRCDTIAKLSPERERQDVTQYDERFFVWRFNIENPADCAQWLEVVCPPFFRCAEVTGPRN